MGSVTKTFDKDVTLGGGKKIGSETKIGSVTKTCDKDVTLGSHPKRDAYSNLAHVSIRQQMPIPTWHTSAYAYSNLALDI
jgi:hypothetical protein